MAKSCASLCGKKDTPTSYRIVPHSLSAFSHTTAPCRSTPLKVHSAEAVDDEGNLISDFSGTTAGARVKLKNSGADLEKAVVICAAVDENSMVISCGRELAELAAGEEKELVVMAREISDEVCGLKVFIWKGFGENQIPHTIHKTLIWEED